ncbi:hypothetical protein JRG66_02775 [Salinimicrobium tongyeongense]|uniref:DUF7793 domain-containing protein n=1 Tax=Salinimicrobium tongyeongense TaxID=2809707 RepID=A0ABY6NSF2_9FLAO|nr:hypothetical protein [Salinimicrobium tongyeongense]UZH55825.1 hypothetical protein JRG66_02775 [Salinimicrobium tongyeongense]
MNKSLSNDYATFWVDDGILHFIYHPEVVIDLFAAEKVVADRLKCQEDKYYPVFCDTRGIKDTDKSARDYLAREGSILTSAVAFLVNPPISQAIIDFYVRTSKPITPTNIFTEKYDALKFLKTYR